MEELQKLSTGQQDFTVIREKNLVYVDKTMYIYQLMRSQIAFFFLSRPRRFGKSLFINTLKEVFLGNKALFKGLFIEDKIDWKVYPVLHFDFSLIQFKEIGLVQALEMRLIEIARSYQVELFQPGIGLKFKELIEKLHEKTGEQVVILIDEYDKPITDYLEFGESSEAQRNILRDFYGPIKGSSAHIRFFFLTGISRFSRLSLFSTLNNLTDLTFYDDYHNICGYTKEELEGYFHEHLKGVAQERGITLEDVLEDVRSWYNGYSWNGKDRVYNPFSILQFLSSRKFSNYWFESGTPRFLIQLLRPNFRYELNNTAVGMDTFNSYDISNLNINTLLFQTGYLTIKEKDYLGDFMLGYPNKEVEQSMLKYLLMDYGNDATNPALANNLTRAIHKNDLEKFVDTINTLFACIPAEIFLPKKEAYFHSILYISLKLCGFYMEAEVRQSKGRLDAKLKYNNCLYIFEFKLDETAEIAMKQIHQKGYYKPYLGQNMDIYLVGINFDSGTKEVSEWLVERV